MSSLPASKSNRGWRRTGKPKNCVCVMLIDHLWSNCDGEEEQTKNKANCDGFRTSRMKICYPETVTVKSIQVVFQGLKQEDLNYWLGC